MVRVQESRVHPQKARVVRIMVVGSREVLAKVASRTCSTMVNQMRQYSEKTKK